MKNNIRLSYKIINNYILYNFIKNISFTYILLKMY